MIHRTKWLAKGRGRSIRSIVLVGMVVGTVGGAMPGVSSAASIKKDPGTCSLSRNAAGDLIATGSSLMGSKTFQYQIYSAPQASVGGGQLSTDASGSFSVDLGPTSFYMTVYPNETSLTFALYPIIGSKADMTTTVASCSMA
jgi:hypothetical protein